MDIAISANLRTLAKEFILVSGFCVGNDELTCRVVMQNFSTRSFNQYNVAHLKAILKRYKTSQSVMTIRLDRNKAQLVEQLRQLSDLVDAGVIPSSLTTKSTGQGQQAGTVGDQNSLRDQYKTSDPHHIFVNEQVNKKRKVGPPCHPQPKMLQKPTGYSSSFASAHHVFPCSSQVRHGSSSSFQALGHSSNQPTVVSNNRHPGIAGMLIPPIDQAKRNRILSTTAKKEVWVILKEQKLPFSEDEILDELALCPPNELDATAIVTAIIMKRSAKEELRILALEQHEQALKEQEDRDMDAAILSSESERDVMANRDKRRVHQLTWDHTCGIADAEEFKNSFLLAVPRFIGSKKADQHPFYEGENENIFMEAIVYFDQVAAMAELQQRHEEGKGKPSNTMNGPSSESTGKGGEQEGLEEVIALPVEALQETSTTLPVYEPVLGTMHTKLRAYLVKLLLLEKEAKKFHKEDSYKYLQTLAKRLEEEVRTACPQGLEMLAVDDQGESPSDSAMQQFGTILQREVAVLEPALYQLPPDGGHLPTIFRDGVQEFCMQEDGFEVMATETKAGSELQATTEDDSGLSDEEDAFFSKLKKR